MKICFNNGIDLSPTGTIAYQMMTFTDSTIRKRMSVPQDWQEQQVQKEQVEKIVLPVGYGEQDEDQGGAIAQVAQSSEIALASLHKPITNLTNTFDERLQIIETWHTHLEQYQEWNLQLIIRMQQYIAGENMSISPGEDE